jgi:RNA polymerase sigma-70 factor, ECF subfamily
MTSSEKLPPTDLTPARRRGEDPSDSIALPESLQTEEVRALVSRARDGDVEAMNELFSRYHATMVGLARRRLGPRLRAKEEPDDLAQTTFREATRDFSQYEYRGEDSLLRWLVRILQNKIRDRAEFYSAGKRDISRERPVEDTGNSRHHDLPRRDPPSEDLSVTRVVQREEEFKILREALGELSPDHRKAITLVFFQGLTLRKAGEKMEGRSEDAVRMLLRRAEARLRELTRKRLAT